jgi:hypothetical protein
MALEQDVTQLRRLKLKLAVNRTLTKMLKMYASDLRCQLQCDDKELFISVVDELTAEGLLIKENGRSGALILMHATPVGA